MIVRLEKTRLVASPGEVKTLKLIVENDDARVDRFEVEVVSPAWATVDPPSTQLMPRDQAEFVLTFAIPRSSEIAGEVPFAVKVVSAIDPDDPMVEEGVLVIGGYEHVEAELTPRLSRGRARGDHVLAVDNHGNAPALLVIEPQDPDNTLDFQIEPASLHCAPGTAAFSSIRVRPRQRAKGAPVTHLFQLLVSMNDTQVVTVDGAMLQRPVNRTFVMRALLVVALAVVILLILSATVLRPVVNSFAEHAVRQPLAETNDRVNDISAAVGQTNGAVNDIGQAVTKTNGAVNEIGIAVGKDPALPTNATPSGGGLPPALPVETASSLPGASAAAAPAPAPASASPTTVPGTPFDRRLQVNGSGVVTAGFDVADKRAFLLTDLIFQNPAGDTGTISLLRGSDVLFVEALANFRTLDYHFITPVIFDAKSKVTLRVECQNPPGKSCTAAAYLSGLIRVRT